MNSTSPALPEEATMNSTASSAKTRLRRMARRHDEAPRQPSRFDSRDSTLVLVQSCSVPKAIEFFLNPPSDLPAAGSKLVETLEVGGALGRR
jgi:hypothetical protein